MDDDKYPHWKDALFGNHNAVANLRCAVHYVFWHAVYALIAVAGAVVVGAIKLGIAVAPYLGPLGILIGVAVALVFYLYTQFWATISLVGGIILGLGAILGILLLAEYISDPAKNAANGVAAKANTAGQKAVKTPGVRRVYGECPVSMSAAPKWFDDLFPEDDDL
jgi:hypothetical protein